MTAQALRRGRPEVLADRLALYGRDMQAVAYLIVRDRAAAEDIVADSLLAALDHGGHLRDDPEQTAAGCMACPYPDGEGRYFDEDHEARHRYWQPIPGDRP